MEYLGGIGDSQGGHHRHRLFHGVIPGEVGVAFEPLHNLVAHGVHRIQGGHGILGDQGDPVPPYFLVLVLGEGAKILSHERDGTAGHPSVQEGEQAHDRLGRHGFPRSGFPHEAQDLSLFHFETHPGQRGDLSVPGVERHAQVFYA